MDKRTELAKLNKKLNVRLINAERRGLQETQSYKKLVALAKDVGTVSKIGKVRFKERTKSIKEEDLSKYIKQAKLALTVDGTVGKEWLKTKEIIKRFKKAGFDLTPDFIESYLEGKKSAYIKTQDHYL